MKVSHFAAAMSVLMPASLASTLRTLPRQVNTSAPALPTLEKFLDFDTGISLQYLTSDVSSNFGLFQQSKEGTFSGQINGTLPAAGNLEIVYPGRYPGVEYGFVTATFLLNTTCGVVLSLRGQGPVQVGFEGQPGVKVVGSAYIQTLNQEYAYLNEKTFIFELCGGTAGADNTGRATLYEVKSTSQCVIDAL